MDTIWGVILLGWPQARGSGTVFLVSILRENKSFTCLLGNLDRQTDKITHDKTRQDKTTLHSLARFFAQRSLCFTSLRLSVQTRPSLPNPPHLSNVTSLPTRKYAPRNTPPRARPRSRRFRAGRQLYVLSPLSLPTSQDITRTPLNHNLTWRHDTDTGPPFDPAEEAYFASTGLVIPTQTNLPAIAPTAAFSMATTISGVILPSSMIAASSSAAASSAAASSVSKSAASASRAASATLSSVAPSSVAPSAASSAPAQQSTGAAVGNRVGVVGVVVGGLVAGLAVV